MTIFHSLVLGVVEGITEFLPISSTFHLIYSSRLLGLVQTDFTKLFEVFIQSGAIFSVAILYFKELKDDFGLVKKTVLAFLPTAAVGLVLYKTIKNIFFEADWLMLTVFVMVGLCFIAVETLVKTDKIKLKKPLKTFTFREALLVGLIQSLAVVPGVSRAGSVILAMMFLGYRRSEAAKFSFILSVPTILAASLFDLYKMRNLITNSGNNGVLLLVGLFSAFVSAYLAVRWLIGYLQKHDLQLFGWYRILLGVILMIL